MFADFETAKKTNETAKKPDETAKKNQEPKMIKMCKLKRQKKSGNGENLSSRR